MFRDQINVAFPGIHILRKFAQLEIQLACVAKPCGLNLICKAAVLTETLTLKQQTVTCLSIAIYVLNIFYFSFLPDSSI